MKLYLDSHPEVMKDAFKYWTHGPWSSRVSALETLSVIISKIQETINSSYLLLQNWTVSITW